MLQSEVKAAGVPVVVPEAVLQVVAVEGPLVVEAEVPVEVPQGVAEVVPRAVVEAVPQGVAEVEVEVATTAELPPAHSTDPLVDPT